MRGRFRWSGHLRVTRIWMNKPYSIKIFLPGGDPEGLRTIEKSNWSGAGLLFPRALMSIARKRNDLGRTGIYVLVGPPEESTLPRVYIGEGDPVVDRLDQHAFRKDFWTFCVAFTSKDSNLNKAHVQYLEARLVELAKQAKRCVLDNLQTPSQPSLSESDSADAEGFLQEMLLCFPVLGITVFTAPASGAMSSADLHLSARGVEANGAETAEGFVVRAGSTVTKDETPSCHAYLRNLRDALVANGVLVGDGAGYKFAQDYSFDSPSTAAGVVLGRSQNGRIAWVDRAGRTLKDIQEARTNAT